MKVLWLSHRPVLYATGGGAGRSIREISRRLVTKGHEVHVICGGNPKTQPETNAPGVRFTALRGSLLPHVGQIVSIAKHESDVVVDDLAHVVPWFTPWLSALPGTAFFHHLHSRTLPGQVPPAAADLLSSLESRYSMFYRKWPFVTESARSLQDLISLGIPQERIVRIPPGVDTDLFKPGERAPEPEAIYFGGLRRYKRPDHAILASKPLLEGGALRKLHVTGEGPSLEPLKRQVDRLGLTDSVIFHGNLPDKELASLVGQCWVSIHTSIAEGWCFSAMEAAACGVPVVAYNVPGLAESVINDVSGVLVADGFPSALTEEIGRVLGSPERWPNPARVWATSHSWSTSADRWEAHLSRLS